MQYRMGRCNLVVTSPPYALEFKKEYGNEPQGKYVEWFLPFAKEVRRVLRSDGIVRRQRRRRVAEGAA
ncbi:MAG: DNA methyltransferase [Candidatus Limnocylindrales bacterium]